MYIRTRQKKTKKNWGEITDLVLTLCVAGVPVDVDVDEELPSLAHQVSGRPRLRLEKPLHLLSPLPLPLSLLHEPLADRSTAASPAGVPILTGRLSRLRSGDVRQGELTGSTTTRRPGAPSPFRRGRRERTEGGGGRGRPFKPPSSSSLPHHCLPPVLPSP